MARVEIITNCRRRYVFEGDAYLCCDELDGMIEEILIYEDGHTYSYAKGQVLDGRHLELVRIAGDAMDIFIDDESEQVVV